MKRFSIFLHRLFPNECNNKFMCISNLSTLSNLKEFFLAVILFYFVLFLDVSLKDENWKSDDLYENTINFCMFYQS